MVVTSRDTLVLERRFFPKGGTILTEGEEGDIAYLIQSGSVEIYKTVKGKEMKLANMHTGEIFGEMTLLFDENRTASARAITDCNLIVINRQLLDHKLSKSDPTVRAIVKAFVKRLEYSTQLLAEHTMFLNVEEAVQALIIRAMEMIPDESKRDFKKDATPIVEQLIAVIHKYMVTESEEKK